MEGSINFSGTLAGSVADEGGGSNVVIVPTLQHGTKVADYSIDGEGGELYAPEPTEVSITPTLQDGVKVADYEIDGVSGEIRVPVATEVSITPTFQSGTKVADYEIDGVSGAIYTPAIDWSGLRLTKDINGLPTAVAVINDAEAYAMQALSFEVNAWQEGNGDPSPTNIRPFHGWSVADLNVTKKNFFDTNYLDWELTRNYIVLRNLPNDTLMRMTLVDKDPSVDITGINIGFVYNIDQYATEFRWVVRNGVIQSNMSNISSYNTNILCNNIMIYPRTRNTFDALNSRFYIQVETGTTATAYDEYNGHIYTIELGGVRYGGRIEIVNGVTSFIANKGHIASYNGETLPSDWLSDRDVYIVGTTPTIGAEVVYTLATPIIIPLNNYNISTLEDYNKIFATSGNIISGNYVTNNKVVNILN